jgi:hypothetical protein
MSSMLVNRHRQAGIRGAGRTAHVWPCMPETGRGRMAVAAGNVRLSAPSAYLLGGEPRLKGAVSIENPRFADQRASQNQI